MESEKLIDIWNGEYPNYPLTLPDLKKPHVMMGAFFEVLTRHGIDIDSVLSPPPENERDEHTIYYWDLLPVINMTRVINHVVSVLQYADKLSTFPMTITYFLQPDAPTSHSILLLLVNLMAFNENRRKDIAPCEEGLFENKEQVKKLEEHKNKLLGMLNVQAEEKGKRKGRLEQIDHDIAQFEEELRLEMEASKEDKQETEAELEKNRQLELQLEQKKSQKDALLSEIARIKALRVYDAEDIKNQVEQAAQNSQEAEEKLNSTQALLQQKENSLKNLQTTKRLLDIANNLENDSMKLSENIHDLESGDLETEGCEGELEVVHTELSELRTLQAELQAARAELNAKRQERAANRQLKRTVALSVIRELEEKDKKCIERSKRALQSIEEIKELTLQFEAEKTRKIEELEAIKVNFMQEIASFEEALMNKLNESNMFVIDKKMREVKI